MTSLAQIFAASIKYYKELDWPAKTAIILIFLAVAGYISARAYHIFKEPKIIYVPSIQYKDTCIQKLPVIDTYGKGRPNIYNTKIDTANNVHIGPGN